MLFKYSPLAPILISFILFALFIKCDSSQNSQDKLSNDTKTDNERAELSIDATKSSRQAKDKRELAASNSNSQRKIGKTRGNHGNQAKQGNRRQPQMGVQNRHPNRKHQNRRNPPNADRNRRPDQNDCRGKFIHRIIVRNKFPCPIPHQNSNPLVNRHPYYYN